MIQVKLQLKEQTNSELVATAKNIAAKLQGNTNFGTAPAPGNVLTSDAIALDTLLLQQKSIDAQSQQITLQIAAARQKLVLDLGLDAAFVEQTVNTLIPPATMIDPAVAAARVLSAGMDVAGARTPVGPLPKVEGLRGTQGDANGDIDLQWNPIKRGLTNYNLEMTDDPAGQTGWHTAATPTKSSLTQTGLVSGKRYWFRVSANGSAGPGPASDPATKIAP